MGDKLPERYKITYVDDANGWLYAAKEDPDAETYDDKEVVVQDIELCRGDGTDYVLGDPGEIVGSYARIVFHPDSDGKVQITVVPAGQIVSVCYKGGGDGEEGDSDQ